MPARRLLRADRVEVSHRGGAARCGSVGRTLRRVAVGYGIGKDSVAPKGLRRWARRGD